MQDQEAKVNGVANGTSSPSDSPPAKEKAAVDGENDSAKAKSVVVNGEASADGHEEDAVKKPSVKVLEESVAPVVVTDETIVVVNGDGKGVEEVVET